MGVVLAWSASAGPTRAAALPCRQDDRLAETAASLLLSGAPIEGSALLAQARAHGFDGLAVHARESVSDESLESWLSSLAGTKEGELVCGEARTETRRLVLASVRGGSLSREGARLWGTLAPGYAKPSLVVESEQGALRALPLTKAKLTGGFTLPVELAARRVQLVAESASGPRPVAELALVDTPTSQLAAAHDVARGEPLSSEALLTRVRELRRESRVGSLRENRLLADSARRHAERVCELGRLAHRLDGEDPEARLRREHVAARGVGEVIARSSSSAGAFRSLLDSPSHRMALTRRDFTDVGIGQASDHKGQVCLVVVLASWPRRIP